MDRIADQPRALLAYAELGAAALSYHSVRQRYPADPTYLADLTAATARLHRCALAYGESAKSSLRPDSASRAEL